MNVKVGAVHAVARVVACGLDLSRDRASWKAGYDAGESGAAMPLPIPCRGHLLVTGGYDFFNYMLGYNAGASTRQLMTDRLLPLQLEPLLS